MHQNRTYADDEHVAKHNAVQKSKGNVRRHSIPSPQVILPNKKKLFLIENATLHYRIFTEHSTFAIDPAQHAQLPSIRP
jgi:hypothetical protein